jgi:GPH family glycoside/pentoside/hexuronide:cation symporter
MCTAQLLKIVCYNPQFPYLVLIPTIFLSAGMLMFFTLGSSMVGDVCDEDELNTGTRSEGTYYSVFWWFIKVGTAFATLVAGALLVFTQFDQTQNVIVDAMVGKIAVVNADAERWQAQDEKLSTRKMELEANLNDFLTNIEKLETHLTNRAKDSPSQADYSSRLLEQIDDIRASAQTMLANSSSLTVDPIKLKAEAAAILQPTRQLKQQAPHILFRLRLVEIGLPLLLSIVSIFLTWRYPLTEQRCYEIKRELAARRAAIAG